MSSGGAGVVIGGVQCKFCRCEFPPEAIQEKACARCLKNKQKYGNPRPCEHCRVMAAFIGMKCQKCSNSIKKYGPPVPCYVCKLKSAFLRPGHDKSRAMCLMCMFKRQRAKANKDIAANTSVGDDQMDTSVDKTDAKNANVSTPNGKDIHNGTPGSNGRCYKVQPKGYFLQTNMIQEIDYNEEGKTDLIGGWARYKRKSLNIDFDPATPPSPANLASNIGRGTPKRITKHGMSAGEQMIMVLNLQAKITKLNATLSQKEVQLMEKDEYWDRKLVEEKELLAVSEKKLIEFQTNKEKEMRDQVKQLMEKWEVAKSEIEELKEKARKAAPPKPVAKNDSDAEDGQEKDSDDVKRYGDDMDVDEDNRGSGKDDSDEKSDDESDKENTKVHKKKRTQIDSDDEDDDKNSEMPGDGGENDKKKNMKKGAVIFSDSEDEESQKETGQVDSAKDDTIKDSDMNDEEKDKSESNKENTNKRKGAMIWSDSEDDEDPKRVKSDNEGNSDKEEAKEKEKSQSDSEDNKKEKKTKSDNDDNPEKEVLSDKTDSNKDNIDSGKEDSSSNKEIASSDKDESATEGSIRNNENHSDKEDSDKANSDKEDSEKEDSDKEDSSKDKLDKEDSEKGDSDKDGSEKGVSDKEDSDGESDTDLVPKEKSEKKKGAAIFSDSDSDGNSDSE